MHPITDPEALDRVAGFSRAVDAAAAAVSDATAAFNDVAQRRRALAAAVAEHATAEPSTEPDVADELAAALASNPAAAASADWTGKLREAQDATAAAIVAWKGKGTVLDAAAARLDAEKADRERDLETARAAHERAWAAFVIEAREAMTDELERRFASFYADVLGPLEALNSARRLYGPEPVYSGPRRAVTPDSLLAIGSPRNGSIHHDVKLYPAANPATAAALLPEFRRQLVAEPPKARGRG